MALANIAPAQCLAIRDLVLSNEWNQARELHVRLIQANTTVTQRWGVAGLKAAMNLLGLNGGYVRAPLMNLEDSQTERLKSILLDCRILEPQS